MKGVYIVGGYPDREKSRECAAAIAELNYDFIEIGIPFNDPVADGPVIAKAINDSVEEGISPDVIIEDIALLKDHSIKKYIMTYANIIYSYGIENFSKAIDGLVDGLIIPDVPNRLHSYFYDRGLKQPIIPFATLESSEEDLEYLNEIQGDFVYFIGIRGITGSKANLASEELQNKLQMLKKIADKKVIIGFGIKENNDARVALELSDGFVVGTEAVKRQGNLKEFKEYLTALIE